jgi:hypothetical protein
VPQAELHLSIAGAHCLLCVNAGVSFFGDNLLPFQAAPSGWTDLRLDIHWPSPKPKQSPTPPLDHQFLSEPQGLRFLRPFGELQARQAFADCLLDLAPTTPSPFTGLPWLMLPLWGYLAHRSGLFLHGGMCELEGRFFLLLGRQQVGKSTLSRLVVRAGGACLTDENPFVTHGAGGFLAHGSPWPGVQGQPSALSAPLDAIFFLRHAPANELSPLNHRAAALRLVGNHRFFTWCPETVGPAVETIDALAAAVPVFDFGFVPTPAAVERLRSVL